MSMLIRSPSGMTGARVWTASSWAIHTISCSRPARKAAHQGRALRSARERKMQRLQKAYHRVLVGRRKVLKRLDNRPRLASGASVTVHEDGFLQCHRPAVMQPRPGVGDTPQGASQVFLRLRVDVDDVRSL